MILDRQPTLEGPSLTLRPLTEDDHDALYQVASDPLIWEQHPADRHERAEFDAFFADTVSSGGALAVIDRGGRVIGTSRFDGYDEASSSVEIGWTFLDRAHWGGGTNREVKTLMIEHAFSAVDTIRFRVAPENHRSQRAVEKLGAHRVASPTPQEWVDFELAKGDWRR